MVGRYGDIDYSKATKRAFAVGAVLFTFGVVADVYLRSTGAAVPAWEQTLLVEAEMFGVLVMLLAPFVFGILLPLTE
ncbi:putative YccA/Bax inhibitor family protein [Halorubrum trapanicum]|uniref:Putative YccA/Bax inhibitor family protein n=1 Tax=Halorubrum trapanicum TaxID=29284 RepID=A0A8J7R720_9EURY|nr:hypothetical protein [Halorubrum trapanicum]MBP1900738.1 putative YccA/Bax inhibitor family protein [Halorubrum trapanicum]